MISANASTSLSKVAESAIPIDGLGDAGKVRGGTIQCGAAAGQASISESTVHRGVSVEDVHESVDGVGAVGSDANVGNAAVVEAVAEAVVASYKSVISSMARANETNI